MLDLGCLIEVVGVLLAPGRLVRVSVRFSVRVGLNVSSIVGRMGRDGQSWSDVFCRECGWEAGAEVKVAVMRQATAH